MAWLFVPDMEASSWELNKLLMDSKPFVMWRGKPLQPNTLSKKWKKEPFMLRLSGLTLEPSMAQFGVEKWILSQEDFHANPIQVLESYWGRMMKGTYGPISLELLGKCDQTSYSLKTFQTSLNGDLTKLSLTSINWGMMLHGVLYRLPKLEPHTGEKGGSSWELNKHNFWPTPTQDIQFRRKKKYAQGGMPLSLAVQMFPTPTTQANAQIAGQYSKTTGTTLAGYVKMFPTPMGSDGITENSPNAGKLNPQWVAWLMGLPIGWINLDYWETE
jgi:hypothetical protein